MRLRKTSLVGWSTRVAAAILLSNGIVHAAPVLNGFDLQGALVPVEEILPGGPPRDGIPSIDRPKFAGPKEPAGLKTEDMVLGISQGGVAKAYPLRILNWHEVVNDRIGADDIVVTYCPLCGSGMAFRSRAGARTLKFGVSGLLYNSDVLVYDRETNSLWSQIRAQAVSGELKGTKLTVLPILHTTWGDWRRRHPDTLVLTDKTGFDRDYGRNPYSGYEKTADLMFPAKFRAEGLHPKELVLGIVVAGKAKAYPFIELERNGAAEFTDDVSGTAVRVRYSREHRSAEALDAQGRRMVATTLFWFAWAAFHPETGIYRAAVAKPGSGASLK